MAASEEEDEEPGFLDHPTRAAWLAAAGALALRLWLTAHDHPLEQRVYSDMAVYMARAGQFLGRTPDAWDTFSPLGYPMLIALMHKLAPTKPLVLLGVVQSFLGAGTVLLAHDVARRALRAARPAHLVAALVAVHPALLFYSGIVLTECVSAFLVTAIAALTLRAGELRRSGLLLLGVTLGYAILVRTNLLLLLPVLGGFFWLGDRATALRRFGWVALACAPLLLWAVLHNSQIRGKPVGLASNGGLNFFMAHAPYAAIQLEQDGKITHNIAPIPNLVRHKDPYKTQVPFYEEAHFYALGLRTFADDPYRLLSSLDNVVEGLSGGRQSFWPSWPRRERTLAVTGKLFFWGIALPAIGLAVGIFVTRRWRREEERPFVGLAWIAGTSIVSAYLFLGDPRVRVPFDPVFLVLGVDAWRRVIDLARTHRDPPSPRDAA